ncbi:MAG: hypothetical protein IJ405_00750 [Lachnospiraceae bacterium]|nr:hypothetical protein [Lachnospiraceae bacterium]
MFKRIREYFETKRKIRTLLVSTLESLSKTGATVNELLESVHTMAEVFGNQVNAAVDAEKKKNPVTEESAHE